MSLTTGSACSIGAWTGSRPITPTEQALDRKSTRLNSSHLGISYAVFCLKKKMSKPVGSSMWIGANGGSEPVPDHIGVVRTAAPRFSTGGDHRDLPSFPTRRSSDLHAAAVRVVPWTVNEPDDWQRLLDWGVDGITTDYPDRASARSEEHTSELQSLRHLVCRLLLEKKNVEARRFFDVDRRERRQ